MYMKYKNGVKVVCPECKTASMIWNATVKDSDGSITFLGDDIDTSDIMPLEWDISCPACFHTEFDMSYEEIIQFMKDNKEGDSDDL